MKVLITGGSGFVGTALTRFLVNRGHEVSILSRGGKPGKHASSLVSTIIGDPTKAGEWQAAVAGHDVLINLAGASIFRRWTPKFKQRIRDSRILTTRHLVDAISPGSATTLLSTSAVGYYGFSGDEELDESAPAGSDFLARLAQDWEAEAARARDKGARVVLTRFGVVLGNDGGALEQMIRPFRFFVGGPLGTGEQWFSWIHIDDLCRAAGYVISESRISGPVNFTAPRPMKNREMARVIGKVMGKPSFMPAPGFMISLVLGEFGEVILKGQRVVPRLLLARGFRFLYSDIEAALRNLLSRSLTADS